MMMRRILFPVFLSLVLISVTLAGQKSVHNVTPQNYLPNRGVHPDASAPGFFRFKSRGVSLAKRASPAADWMSSKRDVIGNKPLTKIFFPGTHDSGAYSLTGDILPGQVSDPGLSQIINSLKFLNIPAGKVLLPWALTQDKDLYEQLSAGARFLDIRAGFDGKDWVTFHLLIGKKISELLPQIRRFLDEHTGEIVLVEFTHLEGAPQTDADRNNLANLIEQHLGPHMHPRNVGSLGSTYNDVIKSGKRAFVSLGSPKHVDGRQNFWYENFIKNSWADSDDIGAVTKYNWDRVNEFNSNNFDNQLFKIAWTLTPNGNTAKKGLVPFSKSPTSLIRLADTINGKKLDDFVNEVRSKTNKRIPGNVFILDHFQVANIQLLIDLNN